MWKQGAIGVKNKDGKMTSVKYCAKVYEEGSIYGIDGGRISKLNFTINGKIVLNYDRGWDVTATCEEAETALAIILKEYN